MSFLQPNYEAEGPGVDPNEPKKPGVVRYFVLLRRKFWNFVSANLCFILFSLPAFVLHWFLGSFLLVLSYGENIPDSGGLWLIGFATTLTVFTGSGPATMALTYILRNFAREKNAWVWSDFREQWKLNFKTGMIVYIINMALLMLGLYGMWFYGANEQANAVFSVGKWAILVFLLFFALLQPYINVIVVSFDLPLKKIYKNALLLTMIKLPQNIAVFGAGSVFALLVGALYYYGGVSRWASISIVVLFLFLYVIPHFMWVMNAFSVIEQYMVEKKEDADK